MNPTEHSTHRFSARRRHGGYVMAEVILAFAVFGMALAGLSPFVLGQIRLATKLESRFQGDVQQGHVYVSKDADGNTRVTRQNFHPVYPNKNYPEVIHYAVPWINPRMRSLLGGAVITTDTLDGDFTSSQLGSAPIMITKMIDHKDHPHPPVPYLPTTDDYQKPSPNPKLTKPLKYATIYDFKFIYPNYPDTSSDPTITVWLNVEVQ